MTDLYRFLFLSITLLIFHQGIYNVSFITILFHLDQPMHIMR